MSRRSNYVSVPGSSVNWTQGVSRSLADLSNSFRQQATEEERAAERELARELENQRYKETLNYRRSQDEKNDQRYRENLANKNARFAVEDQRFLDREAAIKANKDAQIKVSNMDLKFTREDADKNLLKKIENVEERLYTEKENLRNYLLNPENTDAKNRFISVSGLNYNNDNNNKDDRKKIAFLEERGNRLDFLVNKFQDLPEEERNRQIDAYVNNEYKERENHLKGVIERGDLLTKEQKAKALVSRIPVDILNKLENPALAYNIINSRVSGFDPVGEREADIKAVKASNDAEQQRFKNELEIAKLQKSLKTSSSSNSKDSAFKPATREQIIAMGLKEARTGADAVVKSETADTYRKFVTQLSAGLDAYNKERGTNIPLTKNLVDTAIADNFDNRSYKIFGGIDTDDKTISQIVNRIGKAYENNTNNFSSDTADIRKPQIRSARNLDDIILSRLGVGNLSKKLDVVDAERYIKWKNDRLDKAVTVTSLPVTTADSTDTVSESKNNSDTVDRNLDYYLNLDFDGLLSKNKTFKKVGRATRVDYSEDYEKIRDLEDLINKYKRTKSGQKYRELKFGIPVDKTQLEDMEKSILDTDI